MNRDWTERIDHALTGSRFINGLAQVTQRLVTAIFTPLRFLKTFLNGTWLEHPLHPVITDVPIGAWTVALLLDLIALIFGVTGLGLASAIAVGLGILAALAAAVTGFADWMDVDPPELAVGITHALFNLTATVLFAVAFVVQWASNWTINWASFIPALVGYLVVSAGAYLGGSLVFRMGTMIDRDAYLAGPDKFVPVLATQDLPEGRPVRVDANGRRVMLLRRGEQVCALSAVCSHYGGPLDEGQLKDGTIECPWHFSRFSLEDGSVRAGPATAPVRSYETRIADGHIEVRERKTA